MAEGGRQLREWLVGEHEALRALARTLVREDDPDDLVQEAVRSALEQGEPPRNPRGWLREVLRNRVRGRARRRRTHEARLRLLGGPEASSDSVDGSLARARIAQAIAEALGELKEPYRSTLQRGFFEELTPMEIARADGDSPATVRWRIHEGLRRVRARLDERFGGREQWCGGFAVALALPANAVTGIGGGVCMTAKLGSMTIALVLACTAFAVALATRGSAEDAAWVDVEATAANERAEGFAPQPSLGRSVEPGGGERSVEIEPELGAGPHDGIHAALSSCLDALPEAALAGHRRLELDLEVWDIEGERYLGDVSVTTGRVLFSDGVDVPTGSDAPGVVVHDELASCLAATVDIDTIPRTKDGLGRPILHSPEHAHGIRGLAIPLTPQGGIEPRGARRLELPEVANASTPDPERAVAELRLPMRGPEGAQVRIVVCGSHACGFSRRAHATLERIEERYDDVSIAWLHLPLDDEGVRLAAAAVAADRQGRFFDMHRALFELPRPVGRDDLVELATRLGLDARRFATQLDDGDTEVEIARQHQVCTVAGARGTPTLFVNGDIVQGERSIDELSAIVDEMLELGDAAG